jgi:hypothetical protein
VDSGNKTHQKQSSPQLINRWQFWIQYGIDA